MIKPLHMAREMTLNEHLASRRYGFVWLISGFGFFHLHFGNPWSIWRRVPFSPFFRAFYMGVSKNRGNPKMLKWMIWGHHYFWKHPHCYCLKVFFVIHTFEFKDIRFDQIPTSTCLPPNPTSGTSQAPPHPCSLERWGYQIGNDQFGTPSFAQRRHQTAWGNVGVGVFLLVDPTDLADVVGVWSWMWMKHGMKNGWIQWRIQKSEEFFLGPTKKLGWIRFPSIFRVFEIFGEIQLLDDFAKVWFFEVWIFDLTIGVFLLRFQHTNSVSTVGCFFSEKKNHPVKLRKIRENTTVKLWRNGRFEEHPSKAVRFRWPSTKPTTSSWIHAHTGAKQTKKIHFNTTFCGVWEKWWWWFW